MGEGDVYIYNIFIHIYFLYMYESVTFLPQWVETFIYWWMKHLWERGEEPWASSEAAASGHGSTNL